MVKALLFIVLLLPAVWLGYQGVNNLLGPDAGKVLVLETGQWGLRFLLLTLAITPLRQWFKWSRLVRYRRMLGLFTWFYASLHFMSVLTYLLGWSLPVFIEEFAERPYMALGIIAWSLMVPLGLSSNRWAQRRLGRRWKTLHQLTYAIAILACAHFIWLVRSDFGEALFYSLILAVLLSSRLVVKFRNSSRLAVS
ncbi:MAG: sulfoxide reductase heme-binding subunit YedZ [Oceanicoccus sp.]|jgi:sulfoxide reductase heme-binding subunit YedZ